MDTQDALRLEAEVADCLREGGYRRDRIKGYWDGYIPIFSTLSGTDKAAWDDIRRKERMAEACYDI
jgi:hypothetical protein